MRGIKVLRLSLCIALLGAFIALPAHSQNCETGEASVRLDANNVNAGLSNQGALFRTPGSGYSQYEIPAGSGLTSLFTSAIWLGGTVNGELRTAAATYAQFGATYEFYPGPLGLDGDPPSDCSAYDRIYKVTSDARDQYVRTGGDASTTDIREWPVGLGAPTLVYDADADGEDGAFEPTALGGDDDGAYVSFNAFDPSTTEGEGVAPNPSRTLDVSTISVGDATLPKEIPDVTGDQTLWWVMNDVAGPHGTTQTDPIGMEVRATAFAFETADALNNTTFYDFQFIYRGTPSTSQQPINDLFLGLWADPDLGNAGDDFVGSDTTLGLGFVYNGDANDEVASGGYGDSPPALGYDFFQGPLVNNNDVDDDSDGEVDESDERLQMERFIYYNNVNGAPNGNPSSAQDFYNYLKGIWLDNSPIQLGGDGYNEGTTPVEFMFPADPPNYWSEDNVDGTGQKNVPSDRRYLQSTGPFTMQPDDVQEIVFGVVWSQTSDRIGSVSKLKTDDLTAQGAFDFDFDLPAPPAKPCLGGEALDPCEPRVVQGDTLEEVPGSVSELDGQIVLSWGNFSIDNNYLNSFDQPSAFIEDQNATDTTYTLEGYIVYQYPSLDTAPDAGTVVQTIDKDNGVTNIIQDAIDPNSGAPIREVVVQGKNTGLRNYINITQSVLTGQALNNYTEYFFGVQAYAYNAASSPKVQFSPITRVRVVPSQVGSRNGGTETNTDAEGVINGQRIAGTGGGIFNATVTDPTAVTGQNYNLNIVEVQTDEGSQTSYNLVREDGTVILDAQDYYDQKGELPPEGDDIFTEDGLSFTIRQPSPGLLGWVEQEPVAGSSLISSFSADGLLLGYLPAQSTTNSYISGFAPTDYEIRFTDEGSIAATIFSSSAAKVMHVPFEVWDIGVVPPGTENDPSDDQQIMGAIYSNEDGGECEYAFGDSDFAGRPTADEIYGIYPSAGNTYQDFEDQYASQVENGGGCIDRPSGALGFYDFSRFPLYDFVYADNSANVEGGSLGSAPPTGQVSRVYSTDPFQLNDQYQFSTEEVAPRTNVFADSSEFTKDQLDRVAIAPNPYRGSSVYDVSNTQDQVRLVNLPKQATIRIFSLDGRLIRQLEKRNPDEDYLAWDLRTTDGLPIASGIYLVHVKVPGVGDTAFKFAVVKKEIQLDVF